MISGASHAGGEKTVNIKRDGEAEKLLGGHVVQKTAKQPTFFNAKECCRSISKVLHIRIVRALS